MQTEHYQTVQQWHEYFERNPEMDYVTHNQQDINVNGTFGQGQIHATYKQLISAFGNPLEQGFDDYKSDAEWIVRFSHGLVATIYNWKNGRNYLGDAGIATESITVWNIGGNSADAVRLVEQAIETATNHEAIVA